MNPSDFATQQETIRLLISTMGAVVGSFVVAAAAIWAPLQVQKREHRRLEAESRRDRLGAAIAEFVDALMLEQYLNDNSPGREEDEDAATLRLNRALAGLNLLLGGDTQPVSDWLLGFSVDRLWQGGGDNRRYFVFEGMRNLIAWHQGALPIRDLRPYRFTYRLGSNRRTDLAAWQSDDNYEEEGS